MNVKQLREALKTFDDESIVLSVGWHGCGVVEVESVSPIAVEDTGKPDGEIIRRFEEGGEISAVLIMREAD